MHGVRGEEDALDGVGGEGEVGGGVGGRHCGRVHGGAGWEGGEDVGVGYGMGCIACSLIRRRIVGLTIRGSVRDLVDSTAGIEVEVSTRKG